MFLSWSSWNFVMGADSSGAAAAAASLRRRGDWCRLRTIEGCDCLTMRLNLNARFAKRLLEGADKARGSDAEHLWKALRIFAVVPTLVTAQFFSRKKQKRKEGLCCVFGVERGITERKQWTVSTEGKFAPPGKFWDDRGETIDAWTTFAARGLKRRTRTHVFLVMTATMSSWNLLAAFERNICT